MLRNFTVNYTETSSYSVAVRAENRDEAELAANECIQTFGFDHPAVSRSDYLDCEMSYIEDGLTDSQTPYEYADEEEAE